MPLEAETRIVATATRARHRVFGTRHGIHRAAPRAVKGAPAAGAVAGGACPGLVVPPDAEETSADEEAPGDRGGGQVQHGARVAFKGARAAADKRPRDASAGIERTGRFPRFHLFRRDQLAGAGASGVAAGAAGAGAGAASFAGRRERCFR